MQQQPEEKNSANEAQPKEKKRANEAISKNRVEVEPPSHKIPSHGAVTMNQVKGRQPEIGICTTEEVTNNQVLQPQEKKRAIEAVFGEHQSSQWGNSKRPRTVVTRTHSFPSSIFTSRSQYHRESV